MKIEEIKADPRTTSGSFSAGFQATPMYSLRLSMSFR